MKRRGNCYVTSEALFYLLGGKASGWKPMTLKHEGDTHWYLERIEYSYGHFYYPDGTFTLVKTAIPIRLDPTASQFKSPPDYSKGRGRGFLTKEPSKRAREMMDQLVWQLPKASKVEAEAAAWRDMNHRHDELRKRSAERRVAARPDDVLRVTFYLKRALLPGLTPEKVGRAAKAAIEAGLVPNEEGKIT